MVGGRKVLLSIAVLSGLCFDSVLGGQIRRQDGAGASSQEDVVSPVQPPTAVAPGEPGSTSGEGSSSELSSSSSSISSSTTTTQRVPPVPPSRPTGGGGLVLQATTSVQLGPAATSSRYVDPPVYGADGSLTTDTNAPTRTVEPTMPTVAPSSGTSRAPPPFDDTFNPSTSETVRAPPTRPGRPAAPATTQQVSDVVVTIDLGNQNGSTTDGQGAPTSVSWGGGNQQLSSSSAEESSSISSPTSTSGSEPSASASSVVGNAPQERPTPPRPRPSNSPPPIPTTIPVTYEVTESIDLGFTSTTPTTFHTSILPANETFTYRPSDSVSYCQPSDLTAAPTMWSIVHTATITWYGHPEDYTPPFPPLELPGPTVGCVVPVEPPRLTISICASTGTDSKYRTCEVKTTTSSFNFGVQTSVTPAVVLVTTDKNPAVVYSTIKTPNYGVSQAPKTYDDHVSATPDPAGPPNGNQTPPSYNSGTPGGPQAITTPAQPPVTTPITVAVQPTAVIINGQTITDNPNQPTQTVIIDGVTFTIDPTRVIGGGSTIDRPAYTGGVNLPTPTSTTLDNLPVTVSSSTVIIGSSTFTLPPANQPTPAQPTTAIVSGRTFTIGPSTIAGASQTLSLPTHPKPTEVVVAGGDLVTAIGRSILVIRSTTYTYGVPGAATTTVTVDDDVLILGPGGVTARGGRQLTIGGSNAQSPTDTQYALVGGATITKIGASVVVVQGRTYTLGAPGAPATTTVVDVGGEKVTIGPSAVQVGTLTLAVPFGPTTVIMPGATAGVGSARATGGRNGDGNEDGDEEDAAGSVRPWWLGLGLGAALAIVLGGGMV
ncbi:hypothetical protein VTJ49DRAFT_4515 [Mycothermus thermophilus]|uniref:Uncharacterized protein n=1 Tax=Humicola insolens TaxID=85995 RepID=A0ABR3V560_HUMIN